MYANIHVLTMRYTFAKGYRIKYVEGNLHPHLKVELKRIIGKVNTFLMKF